jgi:hypothetical protein
MAAMFNDDSFQSKRHARLSLRDLGGQKRFASNTADCIQCSGLTSHRDCVTLRALGMMEGTMKIVFEKLVQPSGISRRNFFRTGADRAGRIKVTATRSSSGAKRVEIKASR